MKFLDFFKHKFKRNKFSRVTRDDVLDAIHKLQCQEKDIEQGLIIKQDEINALLEKGKRESDKTMKLFYAKKINAIRYERQRDVQRAFFLLYNLQLLGKLKDAIEDKEFISGIGKVPLNQMLSNQKDLAKFLNSALNTKVRTEEVMTSADDVFNAVKDAYEPNMTIYGVNQSDDDLLAMFEIDQGLKDGSELVEVEQKQKVKEKLMSEE